MGIFDSLFRRSETSKNNEDSEFYENCSICDAIINRGDNYSLCSRCGNDVLCENCSHLEYESLEPGTLAGLCYTCSEIIKSEIEAFNYRELHKDADIEDENGSNNQYEVHSLSHYDYLSKYGCSNCGDEIFSQYVQCSSCQKLFCENCAEGEFKDGMCERCLQLSKIEPEKCSLCGSITSDFYVCYVCQKTIICSECSVKYHGKCFDCDFENPNDNDQEDSRCSICNQYTPENELRYCRDCGSSYCINCENEEDDSFCSNCVQIEYHDS